MNFRRLFSLSLGILSVLIVSGRTQRVLFLGNSYTSVNNLPQLLADCALSTQDTVIFDSYTPGGYTLQGHASDPAALAKIAAGPWDVVVLQEQSQRPSFPITQVEQEVFPFARSLDSIIHGQWPCALTLFYMTWGRKNGDATNCTVWPPVCTYEGMDSLLSLRYRMMADSNAAGVSPVGAVWRQLRQVQPLLELYQSDDSHPSLAGSYAAACSFYTTIFRKDPAQISYDAGLVANDAQQIRYVTKSVVFDSLMAWNIGRYDPVAAATAFPTPPYTVNFTNTSLHADDYLWDFGDGTTSTDVNPVHTYADSGTYSVTLVASRCSQADVFSMTVSTTSLIGVDEIEGQSDWMLYPNPIVNRGRLMCKRLMGTYRVICMDPLGRKVWDEEGDGKDGMTIVSEGLAPGVYRLVIFEEGQRAAVLNMVISQ